MFYYHINYDPISNRVLKTCEITMGFALMIKCFRSENSRKDFYNNIYETRPRVFCLQHDNQNRHETMKINNILRIFIISSLPHSSQEKWRSWYAHHQNKLMIFNYHNIQDRFNFSDDHPWILFYKTMPWWYLFYYYRSLYLVCTFYDFSWNWHKYFQNVKSNIFTDAKCMKLVFHIEIWSNTNYTIQKDNIE